ncbi:hypothetical protein LMG7974_01813 [Campylobacter majalis]|uniref:Branched-chain amino acid ABC transporter permease n=1 Tax=Campylobacter majalis TaxID=2790656 RepID=A0ABM8Q9S1_9BACT|nr:AzlC family ABC transporter permease [Campylobacter majalis]CAD7289735.1 hypothetical protein LMG7974_01813 [Campylobacter majalis]
MKFSEIFSLTIAIFMGYFPLGVAYGIVANTLEVSAFIAIALSALAYGGAAQFMMLSFFSVGTNFAEVFIVSYLINLRHTFYGLTLLKEYEGIKYRLYNIATLTDETFATFKTLNISNKNERGRVFAMINFLSWLYWLIGSMVGCLAAGFISVDMSGLEFSLTALFLVIVIEMFKVEKNLAVLSVACLISILSVAFLPDKILLVGSMMFCVVFILAFKDRL